jgi:hypothetical protein
MEMPVPGEESCPAFQGGVRREQPDCRLQASRVMRASVKLWNRAAMHGARDWAAWGWRWVGGMGDCKRRG